MECKQNICFRCWKKRLDSITVLNLLLALGGLNRWWGSTCCLPAVCLPRHGAGVGEGVRAVEEAAWSCLRQPMHTHSYVHTHLPPLSISFLPVCCPCLLSPLLPLPLPLLLFLISSFISLGLFESLLALSLASFWCLLSLQRCLHPQPSPASSLCAHGRAHTLYFSHCIFTIQIPIC